jgi:antigen flippase
VTNIVSILRKSSPRFSRWSHFFSSLIRSKSLEKHLTIVFMTNFVLMALSFMTGTLTARLLGPEGRGQLVQIQIWAFFLLGMGHLAVPDALVYYTSHSPEKLGKFVTSAWMVMIPLSALWIVAGYFALPVILHHQSTRVIQYAQLSLLLLPIAYFAQVIRAFWGTKQFSAVALVQIHRPVLYLLLLIILGITKLASPYTIAVGYVIVVLFSPFLTLWIITRYRTRLSWPSLQYARQLLWYGVRSVLGSLPDQLNSRMDQMLMAIWLPDKELGLYAVAVTWSIILSGLFQAVGTVTFPYLAGEKSDESRSRRFATTIRLAVIMTTLLGLGMLAVTPIMLPLIFGNSFRGAIGVALILVVASGFYNVKIVLARSMQGLGTPEAIAFAEGTALSITIVLLVLTLRPFGMYAAAVTSIIAYFVSAAILVYFGLRRTGCRWQDVLIPRPADVRMIVFYLYKRLAAFQGRSLPAAASSQENEL